MIQINKGENLLIIPPHLADNSSEQCETIKSHASLLLS